MKKNPNLPESSGSKQIPRIMKISVLLFFIGMTTVFATPGFSQPEKVSLQMNDVTLRDVFHEIEKQSDYSFFYNDQFADLNRMVAINESESSIKDVLHGLLNSTDLSYKLLDDNLIVITPKQEQLIIKGKVTDSEGKPLQGVTIIVKGTINGTSTNSSGNYEIEVKPADEILTFSFLGMESQEVEISGRSVINVTMLESTAVIDDVVVIGYGTARKRDLTGSVVSVKADDVKNIPVMTIDDALTGKAAGVQIIKADGSPGGGVRMRIRGGTSLMGGNDPLYIIDGVQVTPQNKYIENEAEIVNPVEWSTSQNGSVSGAFARGLNNLGGLNINDIETIDILKDASATAIYGSKAANGVVVITTKKGKTNQKPTLEVNFNTGLSIPINEERLNREQYIQILQEGATNLNEARATLGLEPTAQAQQILNDPDFFGPGDTDWLDLVTRTAVSTSLDLSVRGGGTGSRYYTSLSYSGQEGVLLGTDFSRLSGMINLDNEITERLRVLTNINLGLTNSNITNGIYSSAQFVPPTFEPYNDDGSINLFNGSVLGAYTSIQNPLALLKGINTAKTASVIGSISLEYDILKTLKFRSTASANYSGYHQLNFVPSIAKVSGEGGPEASDGGVGSQGQTEQSDLFFENTLTWNQQLNDNNRISLLAGTTWQQSKLNSFSASGRRFPDDEYLNGLSSAAVALPPTASNQQNSLLSFYMRASYALKERYLLTFTGRSDASSKFPKANRVGYFPSLGLAWLISEENFMQGMGWLDELKLRASAGYTGTQNIGNNMFYTLYSPASYGGNNALLPSQLGNDNIKWETTFQQDYGIDFAMFDSRVRGSVGYYQKNTDGILIASSVPASSGFSSVIKNVATIQNKGLEIDLTGEFIRTRDFRWAGSLNISMNRSKVLKLEKDMDDPSNASSYDDPFYNAVFMGNTIIREGQPIGLLYGYEFLGLLKTEEEVADYKEKSIYAMYGILPYLGIGDAQYALVDTGMYAGYFWPDVIGNAVPKFYGGYTNTFSYKNFSLATLFTFSYGNDIYYLSDMENLDYGFSNHGVRIFDRYHPENNPDGEIPRIVLGESGAYGTSPSSIAVHDGSYIKLKSLTLSWMFPTAWSKKLNVSNASAHISATNLFTITNYPGSDPEITDDPYSLIGGYSDSGSYPTIKQFNLGIRFNF